MFERKTQTSVTQKDREGDYANVHGCARAAYGMDGTRVCVDMESKRAQKTVGHRGGEVGAAALWHTITCLPRIERRKNVGRAPTATMSSPCFAMLLLLFSLFASLFCLASSLFLPFQPPL